MMLQAALDTTSRDTEFNRRAHFRTRPQWASLIDDPCDPIYDAMNEVKCAVYDMDAFYTRKADAELSNGAELPPIWETVGNEHDLALTKAVAVLTKTVPTTKRGIFELLNFLTREVDSDLIGHDENRQILTSIETALLALNG